MEGVSSSETLLNKYQCYTALHPRTECNFLSEEDYTASLWNIELEIKLVEVSPRISPY
jgi:hypothetical protein